MSFIKNKRILVTGGAGSIGQELVRQLAVNNKIFILDQNETATFDLRTELKERGYWVHSRTGDIRDKATVADVFDDFKPQYIFHTAALKHVTPNEEYPLEAIQTNILGTYNVIAEAKRWECLEKFVFISTDKVVNANCIMGITKLCAEGLVRRAGEKFVAVRFGNVMGSRGSVIPIWQKQFDQKKPLTVTDERMERYMMSIPEACELVIKAAEKGKNGEVWILDMGKRVNVLKLAQKIIKEAGYGDNMEIDIIGIRPGETLDEKLMTKDEELKAVKTDNFYVIK
jgi:FlaA1/EpsC-like NDP-sugar epimerase